MAFTIFQANKKAKAAEVNANFAFIAGSRIIAIDASTGAPFATFPIGDLTAITNGSLAGDLSARSGKALKVYNASGTLLGSVSYDDMLNLQSASETQEGTAEIATQSEANAGTDDLRIITALKLKTRQGVRYVGRLTATNTTTLGQPLSTGKKYLFRFNNILPSLNASFFTAQYSTDGGSTLLSASYKAALSENTNADALAGYNGKTSGLSLSGIETDGNTGVGNTASRGGLNGEFILDDPSNSTTYKQAHWDNSHYTSTTFNYIVHQTGVGVYEGATTAINYIGFTFKEPNSNTTRGVIASGTIDVWEINA